MLTLTTTAAPAAGYTVTSPAGHIVASVDWLTGAVVLGWAGECEPWRTPCRIMAKAVWLKVRRVDRDMAVSVF